MERRERNDSDVKNRLEKGEAKGKGAFSLICFLSTQNTLAMDLPLRRCKRGEANSAVGMSRGYVWESIYLR